MIMKLSLEAVRVNAEMTQRELANEVGVDRTTISSWETGKIKIGAMQLFKLVEVVNTHLDNDSKITIDSIRLPKYKRQNRGS